MEKDRQTKIIAIVALFIGVATLTLGFATFSAKLIIQSKATVTPDADSFEVLLSKAPDSVVDGNVSPNGDGATATINNNDAPTISGLKANFINPGEKVVYEFYAVNTGELDAFLNKVEFKNVSGKEVNKVCTAATGTTDTYVQNACNSIRVSVKVAEEDTVCNTSTYGAHTLSKKSNGEKVIVTIEYNNTGARADGPFSVAFGDITLNYSTVDSESKNLSTCTEFVSETENVGPFYTRNRNNIIDNNKDGILNVGDKVTLNPAESFYVVSTDTTAGTVTMLSEWNLNVGQNTVEGTPGMQNSACKGYSLGLRQSDIKCTLAFSNTNYWSSTTTFPTYIYNEQSALYTHIEYYVNKLKEAGYSSITGSLIKHEELISLGCTSTTCKNTFEWLRNTSYWTGSSSNSTNAYYVRTNGILSGNGQYNIYKSYGVRPVITIKESEI